MGKRPHYKYTVNGNEVFHTQADAAQRIGMTTPNLGHYFGKSNTVIKGENILIREVIPHSEVPKKIIKRNGYSANIFADYKHF